MQNTLQRPAARRIDVRGAFAAFVAKLAPRRDRFGFDRAAEICLTDELERTLSQQSARW